MAELSVRTLDDETLELLRLRAAEHGVSVEEEARRILDTAVRGRGNLAELARALFGPEHGVDLPPSERRPHSPINLGE
jgi:antitoxin FitA